MKLELGLVALAFAGGMSLQASLMEEPQEKPKDYGENPMANPDYMKDSMEAAAVKEQHKELAKQVGDWDVTISMYMGPDAEATPMKGTATNSMILDGRYMMQDYESSFMGMDFSGKLILGYDNLKNEYVSIWMDTMSTWPMVSRGIEEEDGKVNLKGEVCDLLSPSGRPFRHVSWNESDDVVHSEMYDTMPDGSEWKVMDFVYTRKP